MSSTNEAIIRFGLVCKNDTDYLTADLTACGIEETSEVNLNDANLCQSQLKALFLSIAQAMTKHQVRIAYDKPDNYPTVFVCDAVSAYVEDLKAEIASVQAMMNQELDKQITQS